MVLGVTGLPAAGKSTVARLLGELGAAVADADELAHAALSDPAVERRVRAELRIPRSVPSGPPLRAALGARVFGGDGGEALGRLEALLHPPVRRRLGTAVARARRAGSPAVVLDVPLLFESGLDALCDGTIFVDAPLGVRRRRAARRGWDAAALAARDARQWPAPERRRRADVVIRNGGTLASTRRAVRRAWERWVTGSPRTGARPDPRGGLGPPQRGITGR